jgi:hypothetical protein
MSYEVALGCHDGNLYHRIPAISYTIYIQVIYYNCDVYLAIVLCSKLTGNLISRIINLVTS